MNLVTRHLVALALILGIVLMGAPTAVAASSECLPSTETPTIDPLVVTAASCGALGAASVIVFMVGAPRQDDDE